MYIHEIPAREAVTVQAALRLAAEVISKDMERERDATSRVGCCAAFNRINDAVYSAYASGKISQQRRDFLHRQVYRARALFGDTFREEAERRTGNGIYWMGPRTPVGQKRRMAALLSLADSL